MASIRRSLKSQGFSKAARKLVSRAVRSSTTNVYKGRFSEFVRCCRKRQADPYTCSVSVIANFLASRFKKDLSYSTVCGYRSAISAFHEQIDGRRVGDHHHISKLIKGVFNVRPPLKPVPPAWDLDLVLNSLRKGPYEPFTTAHLKWITLKMVFLLAICTACRSDDITKLAAKHPFMRERRSPPGLTFMPTALKKQSRVGHISEEIFVPQFGPDRLLDPVRAIKLYLRRVEGSRGALESLLLTYKKGTKLRPSAQTVSRWLATVIRSAYDTAGLPLERHVTGHSTRGVSTSWALLGGASIDAIVRAADWSSGNMFAKHYLKDVAGRRAEFASAVLSKRR